MAVIEMKDLCKSYDGSYLAVNHVDLLIDDQDFCVLLGPSGCGKTTLLRMIAGLESVTGGDIYIDNIHMNRLLPKDRDIAMVFQSYALYPHMSVFRNMAFGLKMKRMKLAEIEERVSQACAQLDLEEFKERKPRNLSGGQQQRVALGRALVKKPKVFLMDEPLSNLDAKLRAQTRENIVRIHRKAQATTIYVTHDQIEALSMGTKIVVMRSGVIMQTGTPEEIFEQPNSMYVASFIGSPSINMVKGVYRDGAFLSAAMRLACTAGQRAALTPYEGREVVIGIRPEYMRDVTEQAQSENAFDFSTTFVERLGSESILNGSAGPDHLTVKIAHTHRYGENQTVRLQVNMENCHFFDPETERVIRL